MKAFRVQQIVVVALAIGAFAASTTAASDNSTVRIVLSVLLVCDGSGSGSVISNGSRLQGTSPCQTAGSLLADGGSSTGANGAGNAPEGEGSNPPGATALVDSSRGLSGNAIKVSTPEGRALLAFDVGELQVVIVVLCPGELTLATPNPALLSASQPTTQEPRHSADRPRVERARSMRPIAGKPRRYFAAVRI